MIECDVLVIGAGPAGMAAASAAAAAGRRTVVVDDSPSPGGQIWRGYAAGRNSASPDRQQFARLLEALHAGGTIVLSGSRVVAQSAPRVLRIEAHDSSSDVHYAGVVLATGARERFLPFPGWTLPGVLGAGGLQAMVKSGLPIAGKRVVLAGTGPLLLAVAAHLSQQGAKIAGVFEQAHFAALLAFSARLASFPGKLVEAARYGCAIRSIPYRTNSWPTRACGDSRLQSVAVKVDGVVKEIACDYLGCGFHLVPNLELPRLLGCTIQNGFVDVNEAQQTSQPGIYCAGELTGIGGLEKALVEGEIAGLAAAGHSPAHLYRRRDHCARFARALDAAFALRSELRDLPSPDTIVCRCEDVRQSSLEPMRCARAAKLHTRCGMGPCQGRICGPATSFLFGWQSDSVRPPLTPSRISTLAAGLEPAPEPHPEL